ncbi:permease, partial [Streptococcus pneumoniae]|uniref:permease n=1 Tax=Streptococcus pneumoniae TaxID=1313 RepID=UPI0001DD0273
MFEEFPKLPDLKQVTFPDDKEKSQNSKEKLDDCFQQLPSSVLQTGAIFLSIIIEALPFVLIGSIVSGLIEVYITPDKVYHFLPRNRWGRIFFGTFVGILFPSCECGIVPIINRFLEKKVPSYTAVPFLVTAPVINPIVLFATYSA